MYAPPEASLWAEQSDRLRGWTEPGLPPEPAVIKDEHSDPNIAGFKHFKRTIARCCETIDSEIRQVHFSIGTNQPVRPDQHCRIENV